MLKKTAIPLIAIFLICLVSVLVAPRSAGKKPACAVVTRAELSCTYNEHQLERLYTSQEKLGAVLTYLRLLDPMPAQDTDPEMLAGERYRILLTLSDGSQRLYLQHSYRYLSADRNPWQAIDDTYSRDLYTLMEKLPSDQ